jgi:ATP-dependent exoDNAse (exonuclease V) beta subunit
LFNAADGADPPADFVCPVEVDSLPRAAERPAGRRFGTLVHELLREAGPQADGGALSGLAAMHGRLLGAPREEIDAAVQAARAALDHPLLARARSAEICRRELPVILRLEGGRLLEGVIDLAFFEGGVWTLVDFKSDRDLRARRPHYERQVRWYALAVARITGSPVRAVLLGV